MYWLMRRLWRICRSPHGERGLKYRLYHGKIWSTGSLSSRRAWIEISWVMQTLRCLWSRSPHGERGLKLWVTAYHQSPAKSLSSRRAWIEIQVKADFGLIIGVALLTESVD